MVDTRTLQSDSEEELVLGRRSKSPKKIQPNLFVYVLTLLSALGGFLFGYDTGVVSGAMLLIRDQFHLNDTWHQVVVSVTIAMAWAFSLVGGCLTECLGRKPVIVVASFVFTVGAVVLGLCTSKETLLIGRIIVGCGIGLASMTIPIYIAEVSTPNVRGCLVSVNTLFITLGQFIASVICGAFSSDAVNGWRYMLGLSGIPSLIQFIGFLGMPESPRWLVKKGRFGRALAILRSIRNEGDDVEAELDAIRRTCVDEEDTDLRNKPAVILDIIQTPPVYRALILGCGLQMFQQLSGINTVMYYSAMIIQMAGVSSKTMAIWLSAVTACVNFTCSFLGIYLVERLGRRTLTLASLGGVICSLIVLALGFQLTTIFSPIVNYPEHGANQSSPCLSYSTCAACSIDARCGYCYESLGGGFVFNGSCVDVWPNDTGRSSFGRCTDPASLSNLEWAVGYCPSLYQWIPIVGLCLYLFFFAPGMGPMPWTINSEIYPLWARSTCYAIATSTNWFFNVIVSMTFLTLVQALTRYGAFYFYAGLAFLGLIFIFFTLPETRGKSLEDIEGLFAHPLCCGAASASHTTGSGVVPTDRTVQYVHIRGLNTRDRQDSNESGDDTNRASSKLYDSTLLCRLFTICHLRIRCISWISSYLIADCKVVPMWFHLWSPSYRRNLLLGT